MPVRAALPALLAAPSPTPSAPADAGSLPGWLTPALATILAALITLAGALWVRRKNQQAERRREAERLALERERLALDREKQEWEREKSRLGWERDDRTEQRERWRAARDEREAELARALAAAGPDGADETAYRARLHDDLGRLEILGMHRPLDLGHIFVQVRVREHEPLRHLDEADLLAAAGRGNEDVDESARARRGRAADASGRAAITLEPGEALSRFRRVVVLGDPGAGKTTMLRHLAYRMSAPGDGAAPELPVYVELRAYVDSGCRSIVQYVSERLSLEYGYPVSADELSARLDAGRTVLLLDGLDEIAGDLGEGPAAAERAASAYATVTRQVAELSVRHHTAPIAVTCRRHGWREGLPGFHVLDALDFEWPQITRFVQGWFAQEPDMAERLGRALEANPRLRELAANPLLLSLIAIVYERDLELPVKRAALYRRCVDVLLLEWDSHRGIKRVSRFTTDLKRDLLKEIAWRYHREGKRYFPEADLLAKIGEFLRTVALAPADAPAILDEIAAQYGLLKAQAHGWYGFLHLTLQEHFAAEALLERGQEGVAELLRRRHDPWWEEVLLLFAGATADATPLLRGILRLGRDQPRPGRPLSLPDDDIFDGDLLLASRCLVGAPRVADSVLRRAIVDTVRQAALGARNRFVAARAARALVQLSDEAARDELFALAVRSATRQAPANALIAALAEHGAAATGDRFLAALLVPGPPTEDTRLALISGLGELRHRAALPYLLAIARGTQEGYNFWAVEAIGKIVEDARPLLALMRARLADRAARRQRPGTTFLSDGLGGGGAYFAIALREVRDVARADEVLDLLPEVGQDGEALAGAYLSVTGEPGVRRAVEVAAAPRTPVYLARSLMSAVAAHVATARTPDPVRPALLALATDPRVDPRLAWLASACLDHASPGDELTGLALDAGRLGDVGIAATRAAWGDPARLDLLRTALTQPRTTGPLIAADGALLDATTQKSVTRRLAPVLARYDRAGTTELLLRRADDGVLEYVLPALVSVDPCAAMLRLARALRGGSRMLWVVFLDPSVAVPREAVPAALDAFSAAADRAADGTYVATLRPLAAAVAAVADDRASANRLRRLYRPGHPQAAVLAEALHAVAQRARVRVTKRGRVVSYDED